MASTTLHNNVLQFYRHIYNYLNRRVIFILSDIDHSLYMYVLLFCLYIQLHGCSYTFLFLSIDIMKRSRLYPFGF